jgi:hypothetical protein
MKNKFFRNLFSAITIAAFILSINVFVLAADDISIFVDGSELYTDVPPSIINDRTMVPVRAVAEAVGCKVDWFGEDQRVVVYTPAGGDPLIVMHVDEPIATVNSINGNTGEIGGRRVTLDSPPVIINSRTLVPLRFIAETIGFEVKWDGNTQTVYLYSVLYEDPDMGDWNNDDLDLPYRNDFNFGKNLSYSEEYIIQGDPGDYLNAAEGAKLIFDTIKANGNIPGYSDGLEYEMVLIDLADIEGEECYVYRLDVNDPEGRIGAAYAYAYQNGNIYMQGYGGQWVLPE